MPYPEYCGDAVRRDERRHEIAEACAEAVEPYRATLREIHEQIDLEMGAVDVFKSMAAFQMAARCLSIIKRTAAEYGLDVEE